MKNIIKSRIFRIAYLIFLLALFVFIYLYTHNIIFVSFAEHGVLLNKTDQGSNYKYEFYIDGEKQAFETKDKTLDLSLGVVNFKYRGRAIVEFIGYVEPLKERIMSRTTEAMDLEFSGVLNMSGSAKIYKLSGKDISPCSLDKAIVGAGNIDLYKDRDGKIRTVIIDGDPELDYIRVGIKNEDFSSLDHDKLDFLSEVPITLEDKKSGKIISIPSETQITMTPAQDGISIAFSDNFSLFTNRIYIYCENKQSFIKVLSFKRSYGQPVFRGILEVTRNSDKLRIINELSLEDYLYQVVPSEMPANFGTEALRAQAVVARTYAISEILSETYCSSGFHLDDSTMCQVYNNISENNAASKAVNDTKGLVLKYDGEIIDAMFYSTSQGYGTNANEIWSNNGKFPGDIIPYLTAQSYLLDGSEIDLSNEDNAYKFFKDWSLKSYDSNSPYFRWKVTFTKDELKNTIEKNLPLVYAKQKDFVLTLVDGKFESRDIPQNCLGDLTDIKVLKRGAGGNIMELLLSGTNGTYKIQKELNIRYVLRPQKSDTGTDNDIIIKRIKSDDLKNASLLPSAFMVFDIERDSGSNINSITFYGGGYGHSVGMSQYGASYLSSKGYSFDKILKTYYKDVILEKIY